MHRRLAALSALWFAIMMMAGPLVHVCAMHDGAAAAAAEQVGDSHGGHGAHDQAPSESDCDHCTCLGDCAGATVLPAIASLADSGDPPFARATIIAVAALAPAAGSPSVKLPFSVGPPLLA